MSGIERREAIRLPGLIITDIDARIAETARE
jgi:hypothetical protein